MNLCILVGPSSELDGFLPPSPIISIFLDLVDVRARPVWNRRLAEEWSECLCVPNLCSRVYTDYGVRGGRVSFTISFWLGKVYYQEQVAKRVKNSLSHITEPSGFMILRRPYHIGWLTNQVSTYVLCRCDILSPSLTRFGFGFFVFDLLRCLALWEGDRELLRALELAKTLLAPTEVLNSLWPCQGKFSRFLSLLSVSLRVTYFVYVYILRACTHSIPLARQGATREAFSGMRKCRNTATITPYNTGLCCCTTPPPPSFGHHRSGDFFTVNNGRRHRHFFFHRVAAFFLLPFSCLHILELFVFWSFCYPFMSSYYVCCRLLLSVSLTGYGREMTPPSNFPLRLIWGL